DNKLFIYLRQMKTIPSQSCLEHRHDFKFHLRRENITPIQMTQGTCYHQLMLQQIFNLFTTDSSWGSAAAWDESLLDKLRAALDQQLTDLQACLRQEEGLRGAPLLKKDSSLAVRKYFHRLTLYLQEKRHSPCAWEVVRAEVMRAFSSSTNLQESFRRKD
ncbi:hypothetical protein M91_08350, partial [Bos mutus]